MRIASLLSGGKDSVYALHLMGQKEHEVACCITIDSENPDSYMYHTPLVEATGLQAESMGIPLIRESTAGNKEEELEALRVALSRSVEEYGVRGVVSGALHSEYQKSRVDAIASDLGLVSYAPLWGMDQERLVRDVLAAGFRFVLTRVAAEGLDSSWVGRPISLADVELLSGKLGLNVAGEGGEYESLVLDGPGFDRSLELLDAKVECEQEGSVELCVLRAGLRLG